MKKAAATLATLAICAGSLQATTTTWERDSDQGFFLHIEDSSNPNQAFEFTSPSGFWRIDGHVEVFGPFAEMDGRFDVNHFARLHSPFLNTEIHGFDEFVTINSSAPITVFEHWGELPIEWQGDGINRFTIFPNPTMHLSAWPWEAFFLLEKTQQPVPESGTLACLVIGLCSLIGIRFANPMA